jgi:hypothetical protein
LNGHGGLFDFSVLGRRSQFWCDGYFTTTPSAGSCNLVRRILAKDNSTAKLKK